MKNFTIIFIHGYTATPHTDWYPQIGPQLDVLGIKYIVPPLPGGKKPHAKEWLETLHAVISQIKTPIVLVGHSLGTRTALLYLEKYHPKVEKVFLIAAFNNRPENAARNKGITYPDFFEHKIDLEKIKPLVGEFIVMHSKDDPSIPYAQGVEIAKELNADLKTYDDASHFFKPKYMPYVLAALREKLQF